MADISKVQILDGTYNIKDATSRQLISTLSSKIDITNIFKNKKTIIIGDSLDLIGRWGDYFITYSGCDGENYGNGSAGFMSEGITSPYVGMNFTDMLNYIASGKTETERNNIEYIIVGGGINDALNSYSSNNIYNAVNGFISTAKNYFVNAKIIIIPIHTFKWLQDIEINRYDTIISACKNNGVLTTDDFLFWTVDNRNYDSGDHTHLTDAGYQVLANRVLSFLNGTNLMTYETIGYELAENWEIYHNTFHIIKKGNVAYITGTLHYTGGALEGGEEILSFDDGNYITGSSYFNKYIPTVYYTGGSETLSTVNVIDGKVKVGRPYNFTELNNSYLYINGEFPIGLG